MINQKINHKELFKKILLDIIFIFLCLLVGYFIFVGHIFIAKLTQKDQNYAILMQNIPIINLGLSLILCLLLIVALSWAYEKIANKNDSNQIK